MEKPKRSSGVEPDGAEEETVNVRRAVDRYESDPFEQALRDFYAEEKMEIDVPMARLMARAAKVYQMPPGSEAQVPGSTASPMSEASPASEEPPAPEAPRTPEAAVSSKPPVSSEALPWWQRMTWWWGAGLMAAAACALVVMRPIFSTGLPSDSTVPAPTLTRQGTSTPPQQGPAWLQTRGGLTPQLQVVIKRTHGQVASLRSGDRLRRGDKLRLLVSWPRGGFVTLVYRDAKGAWEPLYPDVATSPGLQLAAQRKQLLPGSIEITGAPEGDELIWACFSHQGITPGALIQQLKQRQAVPSCQYLRKFVLSRPPQATP